jgi:hypothetical protein
VETRTSHQMKETMKETKENISILNKLGFKLDQFGFYSNKDNWGFIIECMPNFKVLLSRLRKSAYNDGYNDGVNKKKRQFRQELDL